MGIQIIIPALTRLSKEAGTTSPRGVLKYLFEVKRLSSGQIAERLGVTRQAVSWFARRVGISIREQGGSSIFERKTLAKGFKDLDDFFMSNQGKSFGQMADLLGVGGTTVRRHYDEYVDRQMARTGT